MSLRINKEIIKIKFLNLGKINTYMLKFHNLIKFIFLLVFLIISKNSVAQSNQSVVDPLVNLEVEINDSIPNLIPQKRNGKFGYVDQKGKIIITPEYSNVGFFAEDCNLINSPNQQLRKFGSKEYASVTIADKDYRINTSGKKVYQFKKEDLGLCERSYTSQLYHAYVLKGFYGIIEDANFNNPADYREFKIYPQYQYLYILTGDDPKNPMIIATHNNFFGVIDINNKVIIPFIYSDIKRNFSWKLARMFEVTKDGENYYFIDAQNKGY